MLEGMLNDICGPDILSGIAGSVSVNLFDPAGKYSAVLSIVKTIYNDAIKPVAMYLMMIYFMLAIIDKLSSENFTWEQLWRQMCMLLVSKFLIDYGFTLLEYFSQIGVLVVEEVKKVHSANPSFTIDAAVIIDNFRKSLGMTGVMKFLADIILFVYLLIPWLLAWIMRLCVSVICYSRVIEIFVRATFVPIAVSDFFHAGLQGSGWRYLKNFLAICLQGAMLLAISIIFNILFSSISASDTNLFTFIGTYLAFYASAIMLMFKSLSLSKEIIGTN